MRAKRTDANHAEIRDALRDIPGVTVADTSGAGNGFPDLVVGYRKQNHLFELKDEKKPPSARKLSEAQKKFFKSWTGTVLVIKSLDEALAALGIYLEAA